MGGTVKMAEKLNPLSLKGLFLHEGISQTNRSITAIIRITKSSFYHIFTVFESARFTFPYVLMMFRFQFS